MSPVGGMTDGTILFTETALIKLYADQLGEGKKGGREIRNEWLKKSGACPKDPGKFIKHIFGDKLGGRFNCNTITDYIDLKKDPKYNPSNPHLKRNKYVLQTTFQTNGISVQCLVKDVTKPKKGNLESDLSFMDQSKVFTRRKYPESDDLPEKSKVEKIVGVDFGETFAGGFVCKDISSYQVDEDKKSLNYKDASRVVNLKIKTSALNEPTKRFQNWLTFEKANTSVMINGESLNIFDLELQLQKSVNETPLEHWIRWRELYRHLSRFYNSKKVSLY